MTARYDVSGEQPTMMQRYIALLIENHSTQHPELGTVLASQCGAQSDGCAYDTPDRAMSAAPEWLQAILADCNVRYWSKGQPASVRAVLASDGWWWKVG